MTEEEIQSSKSEFRSVMAELAQRISSEVKVILADKEKKLLEQKDKTFDRLMGILKDSPRILSAFETTPIIEDKQKLTGRGAKELDEKTALNFNGKHSRQVKTHA